MKRKGFRRTPPRRGRLHENEVDEIEEIRRKDKYQRQYQLIKRRNGSLAELCVCLLERVAVDPQLSTKQGHRVVQRVPKDSTTGCQTLYAGLLLQALMDDDPAIDVCESMQDYEFRDGSPLIERD